MASRKEKKICMSIGILVALFRATNYCEENNTPSDEKWIYLLGAGIGGGLAGYIVAQIFGAPNDTINYSLFKKGQLVYHGITYDDRLHTRTNEHLRRGLQFDRVLKDKPKSRIDAILLERKRIKRDLPLYNIKHNSNRY